MNRTTKSLSLLLIALVCLSALPLPARAEATDDEVKAILQQRIEYAKKSVGIVVGLVDEKGARVITFGKPSLDGKQPLDGNSVFEIGSVTKVFTATLLADMVERGEVSLADPISKYLPKTVKAPTRDGKEITLLDLATQTSGLPRLPTNFAPKDPRNPYADYSVDRLYAFLSSYTLTRDIGEKYEYSNLGVGLLGHILSLRAGTDYETLVRKRICQPLKMADTSITLTPGMQTRLTTGHDPMLKPVANWDLPTLAGAGALRSTVNDMLKFVAANIGLTKSPLFAAMQRAQQSQRETGQTDLTIGLNWHILKKFDSEIIWHNGGTGGYHSFIGFDKKNRGGVVVLSNSANDIDDIGRHLLVSQYPIAKVEPAKERKAIQLDPKFLDAYAGEYQLAPGFSVVFTREGDKLFMQPTGQGKTEIIPESETDFFVAVADVQVTFVKDDRGQVSQAVLHQNGRSLPAKKIK
ncbi:MAG TPA: serine hydrolase [Pyrinomonadaceae bacterium]|nr:serine hydrolase [Pyrinomonadaceae bacterium]